MATPKCVTIDFETRGIEKRPAYPPVPVGCSVQEPGERSPRYLSWGHPTGNNISFKDAQRILKKVWSGPYPLLGQNMKFDIDVGEIHMGLRPPTELLIHDTMFLLFLIDPHSPTLSLKPSAEKWLGMAPTEQGDVSRWLIAHQAELRAQKLLPWDEKITMSNFGKWICLTPGELCGKYAKGDVTRTLRLFKLLYPKVVAAGMLPAYQREQRLMLHMLRNERQGIRADQRRMEKDAKMYEGALETVEQWLRKALKAPELDFDSDRDMAEILDSRGIVTEWTLTAKSGQRSVSKKYLKPEHFAKPRIANALGYRNRLTTCLGMYYKNWLAMVRNSDGRIFTEWNQVRQSRDEKSNKGARTGRLSASLFMNVPKTWDDKNDGYVHPDHLDLPPLPLMRRYVLPDAPDHWFGRRDFNQQELRILAHFESGLLLQAYVDNPFLDTHRFVQLKIEELLNMQVERTPVKTINFGYIYGQGVPSLAEKIDRPVAEIHQLRNAQLVALPGLKELSRDIKARGKAGEPIRTWGGREYYCEEPAFSKKYGRDMTFEYKLLNYLIQGSAADCTKEAVIRYHEHPKREGRMVVTVHDEINPSAPKGIFKQEMLVLRECMLSTEFDVPMISDGEYGPNWADLKDLKGEPPFDLSRWSV